MRTLSLTHTCTQEECEHEFELNITVISRGCGAQISGPPEHCYPAEPIEFEVKEDVCPKCGHTIDVDSDDLYMKVEEALGDEEADSYEEDQREED